MVVFFFKQKTAYEMRISDWSSDVCSSDLCRDQFGIAPAGGRHRDRTPGADAADRHGSGDRRGAGGSGGCRGAPESGRLVVAGPAAHRARAHRDRAVGGRSEEHTSELQSLMRISYAVFCLKKKKQQEYKL